MSHVVFKTCPCLMEVELFWECNVAKALCRVPNFKSVCVGVSILGVYTHSILKLIFLQKLRLRWLHNANKIDTNSTKCTWPTRPNPCVPNADYIPPARIGGLVGLRWHSRWVHWHSCWVHKGFLILTCWYWQCEGLALGVLANANHQCEWFCISVEYRL